MKRFFPYILIILVLAGIGLFGQAIKASASVANPTETCARVPGPGPAVYTNVPCIDSNGVQQTTAVPTATPPTNQTEFEKRVQEACGINPISEGCILRLFYWIFHDIPAWFLLQTAYFFNVLISISLSSALFTSGFVSIAWRVVRDLSNLFFILILLYIAIQVILGIGGTDVKKMIARVIIMALLINFSMFITEVVIDTSNILALIFYSKVNVCINKNATTGVCRPYDPVAGEKDVSGGLVSGFDPTTKIGEGFFVEAKKTWNPDGTRGSDEAFVPFGIMLSVTLLSGLVMCFAIYALFISGLSFVGRLIELWVLIIFSPFAFMSSTVPKLNDIEYLGWKSWLSRLLKTAFMAPIFMFFLYFIFLLLETDIFITITKPVNGKGAAAMSTMILSVILPAMLILILLLKATEFAKKGSGMAGEAIIKGGTTIAGFAGGLAVGAATGGAGLALRGTVGRAGAGIANSRWAKDWEARGYGGGYVRRAATAVGSGSFDVRGVKIGGKTLAGATGLPLGEAQKGGFIQNRKDQVDRRQKRAKDLEVGEDEALMQDVRQAEITLQEAKTNPDTQRELTTLNEGDHNAALGTPERDSLSQLERTALAGQRVLADAERALRDAIAGNGQDINAARATQAARLADREESRINLENRQSAIRTAGGGIHAAEINLKEAQNRVIGQNRIVRTTYANTTEGGLGQAWNFMTSGGQHSFRGAREAANKIRAGIQEEKKVPSH